MCTTRSEHFFSIHVVLDKATKLCGEYREAKGAGSTIKPNEHSFYINFRKELQRRYEKSKNENGFM